MCNNIVNDVNVNEKAYKRKSKEGERNRWKRIYLKFSKRGETGLVSTIFSLYIYI